MLENTLNYTVNVNHQRLVFPLLSNAARHVSTFPIIHVLASGPSIKNTDFSRIIHEACIMVNGAICLASEHVFSQMLGLVITDPRFIKHNLAELKQHYNGCDMFVTQAVLSELIQMDSSFVITHQEKFMLIFDATKPFFQNDGVKQIYFVKKITKMFSHEKQKRWLKLTESNDFVIKDKVGVSLNMSQGFIEAGTVAYAAAQLAYFLGTQSIAIHGMDLINANEPRFYENQKNAAPSMLSKAVQNRIIPSFELLAESYLKQGVVVQNYSPVSKQLFKHMVYAGN